MKELSIAGKATRYDEALTKAKEYFNSPRTCFDIEQLCNVFPELKESKDERVRNKLIEFFKGYFPDEEWWGNITQEDILAWLEKQGNTNEPINRNEFAQSVLKGAAINLITWIDYNAAEGNMCLSNMECKDIEDSLVSGNWDKIYAYIKKKFEKQGEQKLTDVEEVNFFDDFRKTDSEVEPKFHEGDWVIIDGETLHITNVTEDGYSTEDGGHIPFRCEKDARLWTINDAKDGDALAVDNMILIYERALASHIVSYCKLINGIFEPFDDARTCCEDNPYVHPATKEQCDLLFQKIHEAGYEWDANKKELKKIEQKQKIQPKFKIGDIIRFKGNETLKGEAETHKIVSYDNELYVFADGTTDLFCEQDLYELVEQKPADNVEPIFNVGDKIQYSKGCGTIMTIEKIENGEYIFGNNMGHTTIENGNKWYLVNYVEQKPAWSEEDEKFVHGLIRGLAAKRDIHGHTTFSSDCIDITETINWLKSLKDRVQPQLRQEWSKEDERCINQLIVFCENCMVQDDGAKRCAHWLKSLRPHNTWKPSDELIKVLSDLIAYKEKWESSYSLNILRELLDDLKKLKD